MRVPSTRALGLRRPVATTGCGGARYPLGASQSHRCFDQGDFVETCENKEQRIYEGGLDARDQKKAPAPEPRAVSQRGGT